MESADPNQKQDNVTQSDRSNGTTSVEGRVDGVAKIKQQFLVLSKLVETEKCVSEKVGEEIIMGGPEIKRPKLADENLSENHPKNSSVENYESPKKLSKQEKKKHRGQNKNKDRPRPIKVSKEDKLCSHLLDGKVDSKCSRFPNCVFLHDVDRYLDNKTDSLQDECYVFQTYGKCPRGLTCIFAASHIDSNKRNVTNEILWNSKKQAYDLCHKILLGKETQNALRKRTFDFKEVETVYWKFANDPSVKRFNLSEDNPFDTVNESAEQKTIGPITDSDIIRIRPCEVTKIDWKDKLYLSPLTTVGNIPFRRLCVEMGADITCSEMSLATSIVQGNPHEFALHRRHPSEKLWGVQLCANNGLLIAKASAVLAECGVEYDFLDLNMGCPLDPIFVQGAGSGLMCRTGKFAQLISGVTNVLAANDKPFTVKMRTGIKNNKNIAHHLIKYCRNQGVSAVTLHGRSREQRYLKTADWEYIGKCAEVAHPMALFGNGDIMSWEDYTYSKEVSKATGVMIGRGALIKPWIFQEIKEQRHIDISSSERLELIRKYVHYGLDHWGSDTQGVATTRRFLLEWLSFFHRYIPFGILEDPPQKINQRPQRYFGRDDMETMLASPSSSDWVKISEMFLGKVPDNFQFVPKHKANAWAEDTKSNVSHTDGSALQS